MILPQTYLGTLTVMILGLLCAGLWANTFKLSGKLRFEVYYVDFAVGLGIASVILAFTFGNLGFDGFSIMDDIMQSRKRQWVDAFGAGMLFNLANMFLVAAISVSGMAVAIPVALGLTLATGVLLGQQGLRTSNPLYLYLGCGLILAAIVADAIAYKSLVRMRNAAAATAGKKSRAPGAAKGLVLAAVSGVLMAGVNPLVHLARIEETAMGPYAIMFLLGAGAFASTFIFSLFFMNLPVQGEALEITDYFKMQFTRHWQGLLGGMVWCTGAVAIFVGLNTLPEAQLGRATSFALANAAPLLAGLCGLLLWKEFEEGGGRTKAIASAALVLFAGGLAFVTLALN